MIKKTFRLIAVSAVLMSAVASHAAAPSADLTVKGTIGVPGCTVDLVNDGFFDFGRISATLIKPGTTTTALTPITQTMTATCDAETYLSFSAVDNRAASASTVATTNFGLGDVNDTGKLGYYTVTLANPTVDGATSSTYSTAGTTFTPATSALIQNSNYSQGWASGSAQKSGKVFAADLKVAPVLGGTTTMGGPVTDDVNLDGSLTLNFAFGL